MKNIRGLDSKHEHGAQQMTRDTRTLGEKVTEFLSNPLAMLFLAIIAMGVIFVFPLVSDLAFISYTLAFIFSYTRHYTLPFRLPRSSKSLDYNDPKPGSMKPKKAEGISFFGNDLMTGEELWFSNDDLRTHVLIFGSTGSGKTEALVSFAFNTLIHGSGFIYVDGKGDNSLFAKIFSMVRTMGRDDDMLLINFMTGARDVIGAQENRLSNTMNPFANGSSSMLSQLVVSLMDAGGQSSNADMWKGRAINFVESLMKILCAMRDAGHILLDANTIRDYFILEKLESIVVDKRFPIGDGDYAVPLDDLPQVVLDPLKSYVLNLPGYNPRKKGDQAGEVREQHGFITMQLTRVFGSLADTYGHIIRTNLAEVDFKDVVLNRRILVVLLPALEKSPDELANLGKIIVASLKAMMAAGLGETVEGDYRDVILRKPTMSPSPYVCIMDEYGYYAVPGFAVVPAQARSLGFSAIFAGQDLPAFQKASKEEAASIGANCNIKICMKLEDPQETWEYFNKVAGETYVTNVSGFQIDNGGMTMDYLDTKNASVDRRQRIDLLDLKDQRPGEFHIFFKSQIIRADVFFANPKPVKKMRINHLLKVESPSDLDVINLEKRLNRFNKIFSDPNFQLPPPTANEEITVLANVLNKDKKSTPFERGIVGVLAVLENTLIRQQNLNMQYEGPQVGGVISAFTSVRTNPLVEQIIGADNVELFSLPLLRRGNTLDDLKNIERLSGKNEIQAKQFANNIVNDIENVTMYPQEILFVRDKKKYFDDLNAIITLLGGTPVEFGSGDQSSSGGDNYQPEIESDSAVHDEFKELDSVQLPDLPEVHEQQKSSPSAIMPDETTMKQAKEDLAKILGLPSVDQLPEIPDLDVLQAILNDPNFGIKPPSDGSDSDKDK